MGEYGLYGYDEEYKKKDDIIEEAYIGKLPEFIQIEKLFDRMLQKAAKTPNTMNPNTWEENDQICKIFSKIFGLKRTWFYWIPIDERNAFTVVLYSFLILGDSKDLIDNRSGKGFYDTSHRSIFTLYGYCGILRPEVGMTGKDLLAIFLHELGHNFDYSPYHHVNFFTKLAIKAKGSTIEQHNNIKEEYYKYIKGSYDEIYKDQKQRDLIRKELEKYIKKYMNSGIIKNVGKFVINCANLLITIPIAIPIQLSILAEHKGEQFADSFATTYGYGPELIIGLNKLGKYSNVKVEKTGKVVTFFRDLNNACDEIYSSFAECHGTNQERTMDCIRKLRNDIASGDYPAGMKNDINDEISRLEEMYRELLTASEDDKLKITKAWRRFCDKFFGGAANVSKWFKPNQM